MLSEKKSKGFTLIEMMVVVFITALLASIIIVRLGYAREVSRDTNRMADLNLVASALELYYVDHPSNPNDPTNLTIGYPGGVTFDQLVQNTLAPSKYIDHVITNPYPSATFTNNKYYYSRIDQNSYRLYFHPERSATAEGISTATNCQISGPATTECYLIKKGKVSTSW